MIYPIKSIEAHIQLFILNHYEKTIYGRYMRRIHNTHLGESCFVIGNGPSLTVEDLSCLQRKGIDSFAVNRIYKIFGQTVWRPTYYVNSDAVLIRDSLQEINNMSVNHKFIPLQNKYYLGTEVKKAHYFFRNDKRENDPPGGFSLDCTRQVNTRGTVTIDCIQLAVHMGYRYIYLIGVDHNFDKIITENGEIIIDPSVKNYFIEGYDEDIKNEVTHDLGTTTKAYMDVEKYYCRNGVSIINASRNTKLEVFRRCTFEEALQQIDDRNMKN